MNPTSSSGAAPALVIDGIAIRELDESERSLYLEHLLALGSEDRHLRFGASLRDDGIARYVASIDLSTDTLFAVVDDAIGLAAAGHFAPLPDASPLADASLGRTGEFGLSVAANARQRGLGSALFVRAALHARSLGISSLFMHCLTENLAMIRIARRAGMEIRQLHGEADAYLALTPDTATERRRIANAAPVVERSQAARAAPSQASALVHVP